MIYLDFDIDLRKQDGVHYHINVRGPAGEASASVAFPFTDAELENHLLRLENAILRSVGRRRNPQTEEERIIQTFGTQLFAFLLWDDARTLYYESLGVAGQQQQGIRIRLHIQPAELALIPWEFLYDPRRSDYVCLNTHTPLVRYLDLPQRVHPLSVVPPLRILGMIASPHDLQELDVAGEKANLERALHDLVAKGLVTLTWLPGDTWRDLQRYMRTTAGPWHIFHFIGHGGFDTVRNEGVLYLSDEQGRGRAIGAMQLSRLLAGQRYSLRLVVLNACEGARGGREDILSSTAATLVQSEVPTVLAMQYDITDMAAVEFSQSFYEAIADGVPVDTAVTDARNAVSLANEQTLEWGTPVLYMRAQDGRIFDMHNIPGKDDIPGDDDPLTPVVPVEPIRDKELSQRQPTAPTQKAGRRWQWSVGGILVLLTTLVVFYSWESLGALFNFSSGSTPPPTETTTDMPPTLTSSGVSAVVPSARSSPTSTEASPQTTTPTNAPSDTPTVTPNPTDTPLPPTGTSEPTATLTLMAGATRVVNETVYAYIPAGEFLMGSTDEDTSASSDEKPQHPVYVDAFWIMQTEVTNAQYRLCVEAEVCTRPSNDRWNDAAYAEHPVTHVTWQQATVYAGWVDGRLPTEAEWEKACRGIDNRIYPWGDEPPSAERLNYNGNVGSTQPVRSYPSGANNVYDMAGNVWEWTADWYSSDYYNVSPERNPTGPDEGTVRTLRGGSWYFDGLSVRCAARNYNNPDFGYYYLVGFRVVARSPGG